MAATPGSIYQLARTQHIAGVPPNADPQRSQETFAQYQARMAAIYLPPDIDAGESDSDYVIRLATYTPAPPYVQEDVLHAETADLATLATTATSATTAKTASYVVGTNVSGPAKQATSASFVIGGLDGTLKVIDSAGTGMTMSFTKGVLTSVV